MKALYEDILKLTTEKPLWYDENGVPRYAKFHPDHVPSIYARIAVLLEIRCQACQAPFLVGLHSDHDPRMKTKKVLPDAVLEQYPVLKATRRFLEELAKWKKDPRNTCLPFHYGDPPRHGGKECAAGDTMNSEVVRVVEYWEKGKDLDWKRLKKLEGNVTNHF